VVVAVLGAGLLVTALVVPGAKLGEGAAVLGGSALFVAVLLPVLTDLEVDLFGLHAKATVRRREDQLRDVCSQESRMITSLAALIGVDAEQVAALAEEAIEDTCRSWRGPVTEDLVREFVVCQTIHLVQVSLRLGGPYRVTTPQVSGQDGAGVRTLAALPPFERMILAIVEYAEIPEDHALAMMGVDPVAAAPRLAHARAIIDQAGGDDGS
jgi:hypothetical protein